MARKQFIAECTTTGAQLRTDDRAEAVRFATAVAAEGRKAFLIDRHADWLVLAEQHDGETSWREWSPSDPADNDGWPEPGSPAALAA